MSFKRPNRLNQNKGTFTLVHNQPAVYVFYENIS